MRRLKQLEDENSKLRKVVADLSLDKEMLQASSAESFEACPGSASWWLEFSAVIPWLGGAESDEGIEIFGRPEGVHSEAGFPRHAGCGYLS